MKRITLTTALLIGCTLFTFGQSKLPVKWDELLAPKFSEAVEKSNGVCVIPLGVIEKHGAHLPLGTDVFQAQYISTKAAESEYCIVFPYFYAGVISEAKHQPGTLSYSPELLYKLLDETCSEIARNGIKKILIYNIHGGNPEFLRYFCRTRLSEPRSYVVYLMEPSFDKDAMERIKTERKSKFDSHGGEVETSQLLVIRPDLVDMSAANDEAGDELKRIDTPNMLTAIQWYSRFPNHYAGDAKEANSEFGQFLLEYKIKQLTEAIKTVKADDKTAKLYELFYNQGEQPLNTPVMR